jgi:hypothetical protein
VRASPIWIDRVPELDIGAIVLGHDRSGAVREILRLLTA